MGMSVGNGARGGSHLHLHGTAGDDPFAGLQPGLDGYFAAVVVADFHFASLVSFLVELHIDILYALCFAQGRAGEDDGLFTGLAAQCHLGIEAGDQISGIVKLESHRYEGRARGRAAAY